MFALFKEPKDLSMANTLKKSQRFYSLSNKWKFINQNNLEDWDIILTQVNMKSTHLGIWVPQNSTVQTEGFCSQSGDTVWDRRHEFYHRGSTWTILVRQVKLPSVVGSCFTNLWPKHINIDIKYLSVKYNIYL